MKIEDCEDYSWRFFLSSFANEEMDDDPLVEMVRLFLEDLLAISFLTSNGERISVDGFAFTNNPAEIYALFRDGKMSNADRHGENGPQSSVAGMS